MEMGFSSTEPFLRAEEVLDIIKNVCGDNMIVGLQQDAHEFLIKLLENLIDTWTQKEVENKHGKVCKNEDCNSISRLFKGTMHS